MRICEKCGSQFNERGRQKVCKFCRGKSDAMQQEAHEESGTRKEAKPQRPLDRFQNGRFVFAGQSGVIRR